MPVPPDPERRFVDKRQIKSLYAVNNQDNAHGFGFVDPDGSVTPSPDPLGLGCPPTCGSDDERVFLRQGTFAP